MSESPFNFELLCVDGPNTSKIHTREHLLHSFLSNGDLWKSPKLDQLRFRIDGDNVSVTVKSIDAKRASEIVPQKAFLIEVEGEFDALEKFRLPLIAHIRAQEIGLVYILKDEVSEKIARDIYPLLNRVENRLRGYLIKFFVTKLGPDWWKLTADEEMQKKAHQRKNNERIFSQHIDNKAYLIDFGEIGKIVYAQSSGFIKKEAIVDRVMALEPTAEAVKELQKDLETNYIKFFQDTFKDKGFQDKWTQMEEIRHKVAHSNLFTIEDLNNAREVAKSLTEIIDAAGEGVDSVVFSAEEQFAVEEAISESLTQPTSSAYGYHPYSLITEAELLNELAQREQFSKSRGGYVGLAHFVKVHLGNKNYDYATSYTVLEELVRRGVVEAFNTTSLLGHPTRAIRRVDGQSISSTEDKSRRLFEPRW